MTKLHLDTYINNIQYNSTAGPHGRCW